MYNIIKVIKEVNIMKKLLAVLLAMLCVFSLAIPAFAGVDELGGVIEDYFEIEKEEDEADILSYGIHYEMDTLSLVTLFYTPSPSITFNTPVDMTVTEDTPIALDHDWVCWKDPKTGKLYYPGDVIHVDGKITLVAVWAEKTDNYPSFIRSAIAGLKAFIKVIEKFLGIYKAVGDSKPAETTTLPAE